MDTQFLKVFTSNYIDLQEDLSNDDKIHLLNYVKEADESQIKSLLLYGTMVESLNETEQSYIGTVFEGTILGKALVTLSEGVLDNIRNYTQDLIRSTDLVQDFQAGIDRLIKVSYEKGKEEGMMVGKVIGYGTGEKAGRVAGTYAGLGYAAIVALILAAGYMVYKAYLSKAARACKGKKGPEKKSCMVKFKRDGIKARIDVLNKNKPNCKKTNNPNLCVGKIDKKIIKLKAKLGELG